MADDWGSETQGEEKEYFFDGAEHSKEDLGGGDVVDKEGCYHFEINEVTPELDPLNAQGNPRTPSILFTCEVLEQVKGQSPKGSKLFHRIYLAQKDGTPAKEGSVKSALRFGLGIGVLALKKIEGDREVPCDPATGSTKISSKIWERAKGKQFMCKIVKEASDDPRHKDKYAIPFGECGSPADSKYADVPKNKQAMAMAGYIPMPPTAAPAKPAQPAQQQQSSPPPAAASAGGEDEFLKELGL